ncbi:MAG: hypothetical protein ABMA14_02270 [Hyphomonadaceae bacterium]
MIVQLCDSHPGFTQIIDLDTGKQVDAAKATSKTNKPSPDKSKGPCVFACAPQLAAPEAFTTAVAVPTRFLQLAFRAADVAPGHGIAASPPPSTGPPQLV